jgi:hypothetical protein
VIDAVRRKGKQATVLGYRDGWGNENVVSHVRGTFVDLTPALRSGFAYRPPVDAAGDASGRT